MICPFSSIDNGQSSRRQNVGRIDQLRHVPYFDSIRDTALARYHEKRDFTKTAEPVGKLGKTKGFHYLIQEHAATRLHDDVRMLTRTGLDWTPKFQVIPDRRRRHPAFQGLGSDKPAAEGVREYHARPNSP